MGSLLYADDIVLTEENEHDLQRAMFQLQEIAREYSLTISVRPKPRPLKVNIQWGLRQYKQQCFRTSFKYFSCPVSCESEYDIKEKINKFRDICGTIQ